MGCEGAGVVYDALAFLALMGSMGPKRAGACVSGISLCIVVYAFYTIYDMQHAKAHHRRMIRPLASTKGQQK